MDEKQLRACLKGLGEYLKQQDFQNTFLEAGASVPMDTLLIPLDISDELSLDVSCNYVSVPETGSILQFYGQMEIDGLLAEEGMQASLDDIIKLLNELNSIVPIGHFLYLHGDVENPEKNLIAVRYTMFTNLSTDTELEQCVRILTIIMHDYELLCSHLLLLLTGQSVEGAIETVKQFL